MLLLMLFFMVCYVFAVFYTARHFVLNFESGLAEKVRIIAKSYENLLQEKEGIVAEKSALEKEAAEIFTLYDMTKEITKKLNEEEAFEVFKSRLKENVAFEDCRLMDRTVGDYEKIKNSEEYLLLNTKKENSGYLALKGVLPQDRDKAIILGNQFALAIRRVELYREIEELAITDSLTGVHTRRHFWERFEEELKRSAIRKIDLALLMVDVDYFKSFNDKYGHLVGDQILSEIGRIIKENVREIDFIGRYGGEEFCVALPVTDRFGANFAAERIRTAVEKTSIRAYDTIVQVTISIGIAIFPLDGKTATEMIDKSDWALYRAKKKGRNCICAFGVYE